MQLARQPVGKNNNYCYNVNYCYNINYVIMIVIILLLIVTRISLQEVTDHSEREPNPLNKKLASKERKSLLQSKSSRFSQTFLECFAINSVIKVDQARPNRPLS